MNDMREILRVRLDKWLWAARHFKTRSAAAEAIDSGRVRVDGERVKPAREVRVGDRVELAQRDAMKTVVVRALSAIRGPAPVAQRLYEETADSRARRERRCDLLHYRAEPARSIKGRPTKREGRALRLLREADVDGD
jgi:ribosome-associated heat shock protein Hsp15